MPGLGTEAAMEARLVTGRLVRTEIAENASTTMVSGLG